MKVIVYLYILSFSLFSFAQANTETLLKDIERIEEEFSLSNEGEESLNKLKEEDKLIHQNSSSDSNNFKKKAELLAINKITARSSKIHMKVKEDASYGNIRIILHSCWAAPSHLKPENKALLTIIEKKINTGSEEEIFKGWMISSSPSISTLEHPVYDITIIKCYD